MTMASRHALGVGLGQGASREEAEDLVRRVLAQAGLSLSSGVMLATVDLRLGDPVLSHIESLLRARFQGFTVAELEVLTPRLLNPSDAVYRAIGCHGVAEAAALAAAGKAATLQVAKMRHGKVTAALACNREID